MEEKTITPQESLDIIQSMISTAKNKLADDGFLFIFWGWLVFISSLVFYILMKMNVENAWFTWFAMPAGGIFTMIYSFKQKKKEKVKSHIDSYLAYVGIAFGISLTITLSLAFKMQLTCYPVVIMLYATTTFITGGLIKFTPLIICGALSFPICLFAFFVPFDNQVLLLALSVLVSYIIPGHLLRKEFKSQQHV